MAQDERTNIPVAKRSLVSIEVPAAVRNTDRATECLGGPANVTKMVQNPETTAAAFYFRPKDRHSHPITTNAIRSNNIVLKRRRKKVAEGHQPAQWEYTMLGRVSYLYKFAGMMDYQWTTHQAGFAKHYDSTVGSLDLERVKQFDLKAHSEIHPTNLDLPPPPIFSEIVVPSNYSFRQSKFIKEVKQAEGVRLVQMTSYAKAFETKVMVDVESVPSGPSSKLDISKERERLKRVVSKLNAIFEERAVHTRRSMATCIDENDMIELKYAIPYVAYSWRNGPFRECYVKYGLDPRKDPALAKFQSTTVQLKNMLAGDTRKSNQEDQTKPHIFDGKNINLETKTYQLCDIIEPSIRELIDNAPRRRSFDMRDGWFYQPRLQKIRALLRLRIAAFLEYREVDTKEWEEQYNKEEKIAEESDEGSAVSEELDEEADESFDEMNEAGIDIEELATEQMKRLGQETGTMEDQSDFEGIFGDE